MTSKALGSKIPLELNQKLASLDKVLSEVEARLKPFLDVPFNELIAEVNHISIWSRSTRHSCGSVGSSPYEGLLSPLDKAKADLVAAYSINSLFWIYLNVCGVNPKDHGIKQELDRVRSYMNRVKEIQDKASAPKLDVKATKRFVKSALWQAAHNKTGEAVGTASKDEMAVSENSSDWKEESSERKKRKRKRDDI